MKKRWCKFCGEDVIFQEYREDIWIGINRKEFILFIYYGNRDFSEIGLKIKKLFNWLDKSIKIRYLVDKLTMQEHQSSVVFNIGFQSFEELESAWNLLELENFYETR